MWTSTGSSTRTWTSGGSKSSARPPQSLGCPGGAGAPSKCNLVHWSIRSDDDVAWEWISLPYAGGIEGGESCRVGGANLLGVVASPWSADAYIWGEYTQSYGADTLAPVERGGVCRVPLAAPRVIRSVLSPVGSTWYDLSVVDVQPNPSVAGELLLATSTADAQCHKLYRNQLVWNLAHPGDEMEVRNECPRNAPAVIAQQSFTTLGVERWDAAVVEGTPSALVGSDSAWLPHLRGVGLPTFYYAGTSGGIWEATVSW